MLSFIKSVLRRYFVPPGIYTVAHVIAEGFRSTKAPIFLPRLSTEESSEFKPLVQNHRFPDFDGQISAITRNGETSLAIPAGNGKPIRFGPFADTVDNLQFQVTPRDEKSEISDLTVSIDGVMVAVFNGNLRFNHWHNIQHTVENQSENYTVTLSWAGDGGLYLSNPVAGGKRGKKRKKNIVVVIVDQLMPHLIGCYPQYTRDESVTPNIDRFFADGIRFENAFSQAEWTEPAIPSMMTGLYPLQHGVYNPNYFQREMPLTVPTLPELLSEAGYRSLYISSGKRSGPYYGHYRGVSRYVSQRWTEPFSGDRAIHHAMEFMETHRDEPLFCFLHMIDLHPPYSLPNYFLDMHAPEARFGDPQNIAGRVKFGMSDQRFDAILDDGAYVKTRESDFFVGKLFDYLEASGRLNDTTVILIADHGRAHRKGNPLLTDRITHVPVLIRDPDQEPRVVREFVEGNIDIYPTVLKAAGLEIPEHVRGRDLIAPKDGYRDHAVSESAFDGIYEFLIREKDWVYAARFEMDPATGDISHDKKIGEWLFRRDPEKFREDYSENLIDDDVEVTSRLRERAENHYRKTPKYFGDETIIPESRPREKT